MSFVETGLTATKYLPQLLAAFDVLPDNGDSEHVTTESHQTLRQSVYSRHAMTQSSDATTVSTFNTRHDTVIRRYDSQYIQHTS